MNKKNDKKRRRFAGLFLLGALSLGILTSCDKAVAAKEDPELIKVYGESVAELTAPPMVPRPVGDRPATKLKIEMEIIEKEMEMADGVTYNYWTFDGTVPGSFIRARVGDEIEFTLKNHPDSKVPHNIDLHSVNGPGGGAEATFVAPGQQRTFSFKALAPGLFVYHCATAPVGMHIANGMYGLILVEPEGGLDPVDREYYVMQGDFYTEGAHGQRGFQAFDMNKAINEDPDYVVFNGKVGGLTGENELHAEVGETVRLFVGNGGPNLVSSFHIIGEIFDKVQVEGGDMVNRNVQTTIIPAGGAATVEFKVDVPGELVLVDHSIFRAFNKGALGIMNVQGKQNTKVFDDNYQAIPYNPEPILGSTPIEDGNAEETELEVLSFNQKMERGKTVYSSTCMACHQANGEGIMGVFPPLAKADYLNESVTRAIENVKFGLSGEIEVNGNLYNSVMPAQNISDQDVANVLTYVYNNWGNNGAEVTTEMVRAVK